MKKKCPWLEAGTGEVVLFFFCKWLKTVNQYLTVGGWQGVGYASVKTHTVIDQDKVIYLLIDSYMIGW